MEDNFYFNIKKSDQFIEEYASSNKYSQKINESISKSNILILPHWERFRDFDHPYFPVNTEHLFISLKKKEYFNPEIYADTSDYQEVALHGFVVILGTFIVTSIIAPLFVAFLKDYIQKKYFPDEKSQKIEINNSIVQVNLIVEKSKNESVEFDFKGKYEDFDSKFCDSVITYSNTGDIINKKNDIGNNINEIT